MSFKRQANKFEAEMEIASADIEKYIDSMDKSFSSIEKDFNQAMKILTLTRHEQLLLKNMWDDIFNKFIFLTEELEDAQSYNLPE